VRDFIKDNGNDCVYVITTKAKEFTLRLLQQQGLFGEGNGIDESKIYGLGSGPKAQVLQTILTERNANIGVMVEDNVATLQKIMASSIGSKVLPVVASWGYNTDDQLQEAKNEGYVLLDGSDPSSLATIMNNDRVEQAYQNFHTR
jgi:hypothetical protein